MRTSKLKLYRDAANDWRWRFVAANGRIVADSAEGYSSRDKAAAGFYVLVDAASKGEFKTEVFGL